MTERCRANKRDGTPCRGSATGPHGLCWAHAPEHAEQRRRGASRGGKAKGGALTRRLHELLEELTDRVIAGELETSRGAVANQLVGTRIRLLEYERRLRETEELEERIAALEEAKGEARPWGA